MGVCVQCEDLRRSEEILTGALPSAKDGTIVVETTWRGGRGGPLWDIVKKALEAPEGQKQPDDWRVVFFPWQDDPAYCDAEPQTLTEETLRYFADKPGFSAGQMSWYQRARAQYGMFIKREFPTVLEECFQTPIEGAIYANPSICSVGLTSLPSQVKHAGMFSPSLKSGLLRFIAHTELVTKLSASARNGSWSFQKPSILLRTISGPVS